MSYFKQKEYKKEDEKIAEEVSKGIKKISKENLLILDNKFKECHDYFVSYINDKSDKKFNEKETDAIDKLTRYWDDYKSEDIKMLWKLDTCNIIIQHYINNSEDNDSWKSYFKTVRGLQYNYHKVIVTGVIDIYK